MEDEDLYRFLLEAASTLRARLTIISDGRTPWDVFRDERFAGNHHADPCSKILKRRLTRRWLTKHCNPAETTIYLGLSWYEKHRIEKNQEAWKPWTTAYPACEKPLLDQCDMLRMVARRGLRPPRLYQLGFEHNNCGGFCVKAGHAALRHLLRTMPERYAFHEKKEQELAQAIGKPVTIFRDNACGQRKPITLRELRERFEIDGEPEPDEEWGGCSCMLATDDDET
jgi:hypothetical protein